MKNFADKMRKPPADLTKWIIHKKLTKQNYGLKTWWLSGLILIEELKSIIIGLIMVLPLSLISRT